MPLNRIITKEPFESAEEELKIRNIELEEAEHDFERMERDLREKKTRIAVLERELELKTEENNRYWHKISELLQMFINLPLLTKQ